MVIEMALVAVVVRADMAVVVMWEEVAAAIILVVAKVLEFESKVAQMVGKFTNVLALIVFVATVLGLEDTFVVCSCRVGRSNHYSSSDNCIGGSFCIDGGGVYSECRVTGKSYITGDCGGIVNDVNVK